MAAILALGGLAFWAYASLFAIALIFCVETTSPGWATGLLIACLLGLQVVFKVDVFGWIVHNPWNFTAAIGGYLVLGVVWSFVKWWFFLMNARDHFEEVRTAFLKTVGAKDLTDPKVKAQFYNDNYEFKSFPPRALKNKRQIILWMAYWPFSAFWTLVNDPVKRFFKFAYARLGELFEKMSTAVFGKYRDEMH